MKRAPVLAALLALAACSTPSAPPPAPPPPAAAKPAPPPAGERPSEADMCRAAEHQRFVGRPRSEIPVPVNPNAQRVACTTCPITMDHNPARLNFFFDAATGVIKEVRCG